MIKHFICVIEQENQKLLYRESYLLDVGLVVQRARRQGTVLLQWGCIESTINSPTFANKEAYLQNVGLFFEGFYQTSTCHKQ